MASFHRRQYRRHGGAGPRHVIVKHRGAGRFPSGESRETEASYGARGLRRKAATTAGPSLGCGWSMSDATSIIYEVSHDISVHGIDVDGAGIALGGAQPLTARGGTAERCLQWGGCVRRGTLGMPGFTEAGVSSAPLESAEIPRESGTTDCMRLICTYDNI